MVFVPKNFVLLKHNLADVTVLSVDNFDDKILNLT